MPPGAPVARGRAAIKQLLARDIAGAGAAGITPVAAKESDVAVKGDVAWHAGTYTVKDKAGATVDSGGYMEVWRKVGGKWLIIRAIWNSSTSSAAPAAKPAKWPGHPRRVQRIDHRHAPDAVAHDVRP